VIVGQEQVIDELLISIFTRSHALLVGVPGLAKTLLISTLAQTLHLSFKRIQFTPDLMPSDITGTEVIYQDQATGSGSLSFSRGRFSRTSCWPMRSTARRPRRRRRCWRRCRSGR
jgi:MoxR-like ATPase